MRLMEFINRNFSSLIRNIFIAAIIFVLGYLALNILPILLLIAGTVWGISWIVRKVKKLSTQKRAFNSVERVENADIFDMDKTNIIDVEYTDVE